MQPTGALSGDEDCLKLDIWVSDPPPPAPAPVIVWLHTGGFAAASASLPSHNGRRLAEETGVIVVAPQYRLGPFGFLAHTALAAENPLHPTSGNYGLLDQRAALAWVRDHIAAFGGDPQNVTLAGTSAGGDSVGLQMVMPGAAGLFDRAIIESGTPTQRWPTHSEATQQGSLFAERLDCADASQVLSCLRAATRDRVLLALSQGSQQVAEPANRFFWLPVVDGMDLPEQPRALFEQAAFHQVPTTIGTTRDEGWGAFITRSFPAGVSADQYGAWLQGEFGAAAAELVAFYPASDFASPAEAMARVVADAQFVCEARRLARLIERARVPTFVYSYEYRDRRPVGRPCHTRRRIEPAVREQLRAAAIPESCSGLGGHGASSCDGRLLDPLRGQRQPEHRRCGRGSLARVHPPARAGTRPRQIPGARFGD